SPAPGTSPVNSGRCVIQGVAQFSTVRPGTAARSQTRQRSDKPAKVFVATGSQLDPEMQLGQHGDGNADAIAPADLLSRPLEDTTAAIEIIAGDASVEQEASHSHILCKRSACSPNPAFSSSFRFRRASCHWASSSGLISSGSI